MENTSELRRRASGRLGSMPHNSTGAMSPFRDGGTVEISQIRLSLVGWFRPHVQVQALPIPQLAL